jgi:signal transduction histidine kinase
VKRRLFVQIYLSFLGVAALTLVATGLSLTWAAGQLVGAPKTLARVAELVLETLPDPMSAPEGFRSGVVRSARRLGLHASVWSAEGRLLVRVGDAMPAPPGGCARTVVRSTGGAPGLCVQVPDGRWVALAGEEDRSRAVLLRVFAVFFAIFGTIALGCWPLARRLSRRLERLQGEVERFGTGALDARVEVEGADEVAAVAAAFNQSAERVSALVERQRRVLAHASHELRSPLARLRMALALLEDEEEAAQRAATIAAAVDDIDELDGLIEDVLLASRLRGGVAVPRERAQVDLRPLLAELAEGRARLLPGPDATVQGDARLLRRAVDNLLRNALRHGKPPVELALTTHEDTVMVSILDRGPGVPEAEADRIFEPFHRASGQAEGDAGVGLGLALVAEIAQHHGGTVRYQPREHGGSCFVVELPVR